MRELPPEAKSRIAHGIRMATETAGMSQAELAEQIGQSASLVSKWLSGAHVPSLYWILQIAVVTNQQGLELLLGTPELWRKWHGKGPARN